MFRDLMPILAEKYHVMAPDLPGFGLTTAPPRGEFRYDFDNLANVMEQFLDAKEIDRYAVYIFDYGAPTGLRLALRHPERISAIISQNGNAYIEGLSSGWDPIRRYWDAPTEENRNALRGFMTLETQKFQYLEGVPDPSLVEPEAYLLAQAAFDQPGNMEIQLDLFCRLQVEPRALSRVSRVLSHPSAAAPCRLRRERPVLPSGRSRGLSARQSHG